MKVENKITKKITRDDVIRKLLPKTGSNFEVNYHSRQELYKLAILRYI